VNRARANVKHDIISVKFILMYHKFLRRGALNLDAEVVNSFSSTYKCTAESEFAAKKPHKNEEIRRFFSADFNIMRNLCLKISAFFLFLL
jgi:hypothetical protein